MKYSVDVVRIRENAEAIAFYRGEVQEAQQVGEHFNAAFNNFNRLIRAQLNLNLFQYAYSFMTIVLPSAIIAGRVISGELEVGRAIQAGRVWTNCYHAYPAHAAFGGYKQSGIGRENGQAAIMEYLEPKSVFINAKPAIANPFTLQ